MDETQTILKNSSLHMVAFNWHFIYWEADLIIARLTFSTLGIMLAAAFVVCFLLLVVSELLSC
eukprot:UN29850